MSSEQLKKMWFAQVSPSATSKDAKAQGKQIAVQFNPSKVSDKEGRSWSDGAAGDSKSPNGVVNFSGSSGRTIDFELMFDAYEEDAENGVDDRINELRELIAIPDSSSNKELRHPPKVMIAWGWADYYVGVITNFSVNYTSFGGDGTPLRATVNISFKVTDADPKANSAGRPTAGA